MHGWQSPGNAEKLTLDVSKWPPVPYDCYAWVAPQSVDAAVGRLTSAASLLIGEAEVSRFSPSLVKPSDPKLHPYLLRGVAYGGSPAYAIIRRDAASGAVVVFQATYDGENLLGSWALDDPQPQPLVAYLESPPRQVFVTAEIGGDRILRRPDIDALMQHAGRHRLRSP